MYLLDITMAPDVGSLVAGSPSEFNCAYYTHACI